jgi:hypothetical protein
VARSSSAFATRRCAMRAAARQPPLSGAAGLSGQMRAPSWSMYSHARACVRMSARPVEAFSCQTPKLRPPSPTAFLRSQLSRRAQYAMTAASSSRLPKTGGRRSWVMTVSIAAAISGASGSLGAAGCTAAQMASTRVFKGINAVSDGKAPAPGCARGNTGVTIFGPRSSGPGQTLFGAAPHATSNPP